MPTLENIREEKYAQGVASGKTQTEAYRDAYPSCKRWKPATVHVAASKLSAQPHVAARVKELVDAAAAAAIMGRTERMTTLSEIARDGTKPDKFRISAIDTLNKMDGEYVKKVELGTPGSLSDVAKQVGAILDE